MEITPLSSSRLAEIIPLLDGLSAYHNRVAASFAGIYPLEANQARLARLAEKLDSGKSRLAGICSEGRLAGMALISLEAAYGSIDILYVEETFRQRGLGRRLMDWCLAEFANNRIALVDIAVVHGNEQAEKFYAKFGFSLRSRILSLNLESQAEKSIFNCAKREKPSLQKLIITSRKHAARVCKGTHAPTLYGASELRLRLRCGVRLRQTRKAQLAEAGLLPFQLTVTLQVTVQQRVPDCP